MKRYSQPVVLASRLLELAAQSSKAKPSVAQAGKGIKPLRAEVSVHNPGSAMHGNVYLPGWNAVTAKEVPQFYGSLKALNLKKLKKQAPAPRIT